MAMTDHPCSGYVVEIEKFENLLEEKDSGFQDLIDNFEEGYLLELVEQICDEQNYPKPLNAFHLDEYDTLGGLESHKIYISFCEDDLYVTRRTSGMERMNDIGIEPLKQIWAIWG